jgi:Ser/Thr protein kinase RdoA (MazF antagonist)
LGAPVQDLAIAAYYLRDRDDLVAAMLEGYQEARPLPSFTAAQFEAVVASRNLVILNDIVVTENADFRAMAPEYVARSVLKLRHYLETGTYRHELGSEA